MNPTALPPPRAVRILRLPDVCRITGLGRSMIYQLEADRHFPGRVKLAARAVGWIEEEVQAWLLRRIERSRGQVSFGTTSGDLALELPDGRERLG